MKKTVFLLLLLLILTGFARAEALDEAISALDLSELEGVLQTDTLREDILALARGEKVYDAQELLDWLLGTLLGCVRGSVWRFSRLLVPAVLCGVAGSMRASFSRASLAEMAQIACFIMMASFMAMDLREHAKLASEAISRMSDLMQALYPLLLTLLAAVGGAAGAGLLRPATAAASGGMTAIVDTCVLPLALAAGVVTLLSSLSDSVRVGRLAKLFRTLGAWVLGAAFTVFVSVTSIQGLSAAVADGVSIRTARYAVDNMVPVIGGMFSDTMDALVGASLLVKNALGVTGLMAMAFVAIAPMAQTLGGVLIYRASAALLEPVAETRAADMAQSFSDVLMLLFLIQLAVAAMFLLLAAQMLAMGNLTVMMR